MTDNMPDNAYALLIVGSRHRAGGVGGRGTWVVLPPAVMNSILPFFQDASFDAETTRAMGEAFDAACKELHDKGQPAVVKELIAKQIIEAARRGERDPVRLCEAALRTLGIKRRDG
jgi:hypothetical protein